MKPYSEPKGDPRSIKVNGHDQKLHTCIAGAWNSLNFWFILSETVDWSGIHGKVITKWTKKTEFWPQKVIIGESHIL